MADVAATPGPGQVVSLKVVVRARDLDSFIDRYSHYISGDRIFIFTKSAQQPGVLVRFQMMLVSGEPLIYGEGTVTRVRPDTGDPKKPPGMEVRFKALDDRSQTLVDFLLATRAGTVSEAASDAPTEPPTEVSAPPSDAPPELLPTPAPAVEAVPPTPLAAAVFPPPRPPVPLRTALKKQAAPPPTPLVADTPPVPPSTPPSEAPPNMESLAPPLPAAASPLEALAAAAGARAPVAPVPEPPPPPTFAEVFRESDGTPEGMVPANPFSEVSDGAIEYFVEWSLEQSVGPKRDDSASFSNVPMALPGQTGKIAAYDPDEGWTWPPRQQMAVLLAIGLAVGLPLGAGLMWALRAPAPAPVAAPVAAAPATTAEPEVAPADEPAPAPTPSRPAAARPGAQVALAIATRPPGANVTVDGEPAGVTPVTVQVAPGPRTVTVAKDRYAQTTANVEAPGTLDLALKRPLATLTVTASVPNASVTVQGVPRGNAPVRVQLPAFESYRVEVQSRGMPAWKRNVYVKTPSTSASAVLVPSPPPKRR